MNEKTEDTFSGSNVSESKAKSSKDGVGLQKDNSSLKDDPCYFTFNLFKKIKIQICKPLIPLKLALFLWFGAASMMEVFMALFFKQRGVTLVELSAMMALSPAIQFLGPTVSGILADKIGKSKPILVGNLVLSAMTVAGLLMVPPLNIDSCDPKPIGLRCHPDETEKLLSENCGLTANETTLKECRAECPEKTMRNCEDESIFCKILKEKNFTISLSLYKSDVHKMAPLCSYHVVSINTTSANVIYHEIETSSMCNLQCNISCMYHVNAKCSQVGINRGVLLTINMVLLITFATVFSTCYRFMDVTSMALIKEYNSDFGRERFFSVSGILMFNPLEGFIVYYTTPDGGLENYASILYMFIAIVFLILAVVYKLEVSIKPPGKNMWKKTFRLVKSPDILAFVIVLFVLGAAWGFSKTFSYWYLEGMHASSILMGLIQSASALYGLPFLATSNWWIKKIGATQLFSLALLGYAVYGLSYSFLYNPWFALLIGVTQILTYHLLWVSVIVFSHDIAPEGLKATVMAAAGGIHFGLGKCSGPALGGFTMTQFGDRASFRVVAAICLVTAFIYSVYLCIRRTCFAKQRTLNLEGSDKDPRDDKYESKAFDHTNFKS